MEKLRLREKFIIIILVTIFMVSVVFMVWLTISQRSQMRDEMLEKARVMAEEMEAVWEYMDDQQDVINYNSNGEYEFKGLHCATVGKRVSEIFSKNSDYVFHYTSLSPRNAQDKPDEFEQEALLYLEDTSTGNEYSEITTYNGKEVFRYVGELAMKASCLECHGQPAGELDVTGYPKEGWTLGDSAGAISIVIPMDIYTEDLQANIYSGFFIFVVLMVLVSVILYVSISKLVVQPITRLQSAVNQMAEGQTNVQVESMPYQGEINDLVVCFNQMARELDSVYTNLESQVENRTAELLTLNRVLEQNQVQLEKVNESLREEVQSKSDFLAVMTHELRTPLTSTIVFTDMLMEMEEAQNEEEADIIRRIRGNTESLLNTINNTLHLFRLEASEASMALEMIDMIDVVGALEDRVAHIYEKKGIDLSVDIGLNVPLFVADSDMIFHILENLLSNAGKFTCEGGKVQLKVDYAEPENQIIFQVIDNGIGIAKEDLERIFDKFIQSDRSMSRQYGGSGLGLTLVKHWTELHGGTVMVESELGKGSCFTVRIPADLEMKEVDEGGLAE